MSFNAREAIVKGMADAPEGDKPEAAEEEVQVEVQDNPDAGTVSDDAGNDDANADDDAGNDEPQPEADDKPIDVDWRKFDTSALPPEARAVIDGMKKSLQADYTRKMEEVKKLKEAAEKPQETPKEDEPSFDDAVLKDIGDDPLSAPIKQLAAVNRYQAMQLKQLREQAQQSYAIAARVAELYANDKFDAQYAALTGEGGEFASSPLNREVLKQIIQSSDDPRLFNGPDMVRNAFKMILGAKADAVVKQAGAKEAADKERKAAKHSLPKSGGANAAPASLYQRFRADLDKRLSKYAAPSSGNRRFTEVNL